MKLAAALNGQVIQNQVREVGINLNYWYAVVWADQLKISQILPVAIWKGGHGVNAPGDIALYRDSQGQVHALENVCPHQGVELHQGEVHDNCLVCPYHGWQFDADGQCVHIPYLPSNQKLPRAQIQSYPVQEKYGLIWIFPGDPELAANCHPPEIPEFSDPNCLLIPIQVDFNVHFSLCNENGMDVFHGFLHRNLQGWFNPVLIQLEETESSVRADYRVSFEGWLTKVLGFGTQDQGATTRIASINYHYPHYCNTMEGVSSLYLMRLPIAPDKTTSFALLFLNQVRLPKWLLNPIKPLIAAFVRRFLFMPLAKQDIAMMESQWRNYQANPKRRSIEINPAVIALQRVIIRQYDLFLQRAKSSPQPVKDTQQPEHFS